MNLEDEDECLQSGSFLSFVITDPQPRCSPDRPPYVKSGIIHILHSIDIHIFIVGVEIESCKLVSPCKWVGIGDLCMQEEFLERSLGALTGALETVVQGFQRAKMRVRQR